MAMWANLPKMEILLIFPLSFPPLSHSPNFVGSKALLVEMSLSAGGERMPAASAIVDL